MTYMNKALALGILMVTVISLSGCETKVATVIEEKTIGIEVTQLDEKYIAEATKVVDSIKKFTRDDSIVYTGYTEYFNKYTEDEVADNAEIDVNFIVEYYYGSWDSLPTTDKENSAFLKYGRNDAPYVLYKDVKQALETDGKIEIVYNNASYMLKTDDLYTVGLKEYMDITSYKECDFRYLSGYKNGNTVKLLYVSDNNTMALLVTEMLNDNGDIQDISIDTQDNRGW